MSTFLLQIYTSKSSTQTIENFVFLYVPTNMNLVFTIERGIVVYNLLLSTQEVNQQHLSCRCKKIKLLQT